MRKFLTAFRVYVQRLFKPIPIAILSFSVSLTAGAIALNSDQRTTDENKARIEQQASTQRANTETLRTDFCEFVVPLSQLQLINTPTQTATGQSLVNHYNATVTGAAVTAQQLGCIISSTTTTSTN